METKLARSLPYLVLAAAAVVAHLCFYSAAPVSSQVLFGVSLLVFSATFYFKFDLIKLQDGYDDGGFRWELYDAYVALKIFGAGPWLVVSTLLVASIVVAF